MFSTSMVDNGKSCYNKRLIIALDVCIKIKVMGIFAKKIRLCPFNYAQPESSFLSNPFWIFAIVKDFEIRMDLNYSVERIIV